MKTPAFRIRHTPIPALLAALLIAFAPLADVRAEAAAVAPATSVQAERDVIYTLLAYAVVRKDWQTDQTEPQRGHNIGSVLVDPNGQVVFWARNANKITANGSQHGEVRLIRNYLEQAKTDYLKGYTIYTTLEPCAMCSGMMVLTQVSRTVYGQTDPDYGNALQRLALDSSALPGGFKPYPRPVQSDASESPVRIALDNAYAKYMEGGGRGITTWLRSNDAKAIYDMAYRSFVDYRVGHLENQPILDKARAYLREVVTDHYMPLPQ